MRVVEGDQVLRSPSVSPSILRSCSGAASANLMGSFCVVLVGTSEGLVSPRVLVWTRCRCRDTE